MKKTLCLAVLSFLLTSSLSAYIHPLIGKWKFGYIIDGTRFYDYVTITTVNTTTKRVYGHITGFSSRKFAGYYNGNTVFIADSTADPYIYYMDGYYFTFQGTIPLKRHLGIYSNYGWNDAFWHGLTTTKLSSSIASTEITTLSDVLNQKALKNQAQLRESMTAQTLAVYPIHPLIGKWKFSEVIGGVRFNDYVTITTVNTLTKKVYGHVTGLSSLKLTGYYNGNIVFIVDSESDSYTNPYYMDGYYFNFQGTVPLKRHLGIYSIYNYFDAHWHVLTTTKLSNSITSTETLTLSDVFNQTALKKQALLRESMTARTLPE
jgi:hypothetical protein